MLLFLQIEYKINGMKRNLATYLVACLSVFLFASCWGDEDEALLSPYAMVKSFSIGNIKTKYPATISEGNDTTLVKVINCEKLKFTIDQLNGRIYNNDSLPYSTDLSKIVTTMSVDGVASIYVDSTNTYDYYAVTDSTDFTTPRKFRIYSEGGTYYKDYLVSVNAHQVDPDSMAWKKSSAVAGLVPYGIAELSGEMKMLGKNGSDIVVASSSVEGEVLWTTSDVVGLPANVDLSSLQRYKDSLYLVADSALYVSADAENWSLVAVVPGVVAIVGASDNDCLMVATENEILSSVDGVNFETMGALPKNFPLYGVSIASYPMSHNSDIIRYLVFGYATSDKSGKAYVWSRLSTETSWSNYDNAENPFPCPSLKGLAVVRYDNFFYALGGAGIAEGVAVKAFESFYVSKDNGIVWKTLDDDYQVLPSELLGDDNAFVTAVDSQNYIWIINSGKKAATYRGIVNRLGFKK